MNLRTRNYITTLAFCNFLILSSSIGQGDVGIRIEPVVRQEISEENCFSVDLKLEGESWLQLASQNYRIYYNSDNLKLNDGGISLKLPNDKYQLKVVQNLMGVDASGTGNLPFEEDLGFINFSVVFQNNHGGLKLPVDSQNWTQVLSLCFEVGDKSKEQFIVLAREDLTGSYGRAFVELSAFNEKQEVFAAPISSYTDYSKNLHK